MALAIDAYAFRDPGVYPLGTAAVICAGSINEEYPRRTLGNDSPPPATAAAYIPETD